MAKADSKEIAILPMAIVSALTRLTHSMGATGAISIAPHLPDAPPLNPDKQLQPLAKVADIPLVIVAGANAGFSTLQALIAKARETDVPVGNSGQYTAHHLSGELLASTARARLTSVPYRGSAPAVTDILGGQVPAAIVDLTSVAPHLKSGAARALAVTSGTRTRLAPEIPTVAEAGVPGFEVSTWWGVLAPARTPPTVVERLNRVIQDAAASEMIQGRLAREGAEPLQTTPAAFGKVLAQELESWRSIAASAQLSSH